MIMVKISLATREKSQYGKGKTVTDDQLEKKNDEEEEEEERNKMV